MENKSDTNKVRTDNMGRVIFLSTIAAIGGFLFGFDSGVINGTVGALQEAFNSDAVGTGFNVASMLLGCALGAFFGGNLADKFGRKPILLITAVAFIISAYGSGAAGSSLIFVMARILGGFAVGAASVLVPAYISEIAPPKVRGALTTLMQLMIVIGLFIAFISNYNIAGSAGGATEPFWGGFDAWQWMFWVEMIPAGFFFLGLLFIPESPRYLVAAGKLEKAKAVLNSLSYEDTANEKIKDIQSTLEKIESQSFQILFPSIPGKFSRSFG